MHEVHMELTGAIVNLDHIIMDLSNPDGVIGLTMHVRSRLDWLRKELSIFYPEEGNVDSATGPDSATTRTGEEA